MSLRPLPTPGGQRPPPPPRWLGLDVGLGLVVAAGLAGALWVSDDYDQARFVALAVGAPLAVLYYALIALYPDWWRQMRRPRGYLLAALYALFFTGVVPLVNALTARGPSVKRTVESGARVVTRDVRRGGLGLLFKARW